jgi:AraC family transcriptional regulator
MEWLKKINLAIDYIEINLTSHIDYSKAARIACSSLTSFQKMFLFATDKTLSEYVRYRRMTLAAQELVKGNDKIIDLALKYGYESPAAFTRAFQAFHGIPPTSVRKLGIYTDYPRITLSIKISGGNMYMSKKSLLRIEEHGNEHVVSFHVDCKAPETAAWEMLRKWCTDYLNDYTVRRFIGCAPKGHHPDGEQHQPKEEEIRHEYMAQMLLFEEESKNEAFKGADVTDAPKGLFLVGDVTLNEFDDNGNLDIGSSMMKSFEVMKSFIDNTCGYSFDMESRPYYEEHVFSKEWFHTGGDPDGFKLWIPIKKEA